MTNCTQMANPGITDTDIRGVFYTPASNETFVVGTNASLTAGRAHWGTTNGFGPSVMFKSITMGLTPLYDIHGLSRDLLFAVGGRDEAAVYRFKPDMGPAGDWAKETLPAAPAPKRWGILRGVWVVHDKLAFVVGEANTAFMWDGTAWSALPAPPAADRKSVV